MTKKEAAEKLFNDGVMQKDIADILGITERTVTNWVTKHNWKEKRTRKAIIQDSVREDVFELIAYQTKVLRYRKRMWEEDFAKVDAGKMQVTELKLMERGDTDALAKLFATVKGKVNDWSDYVEIINEFLKFMESEDFALAKALTDATHRFLNAKREAL